MPRISANGAEGASSTICLRPMSTNTTASTDGKVIDLAAFDALLPKVCQEIKDFLGCNNLEATYQRALKVELEERGLQVDEEIEIKLIYKGKQIGTRRADLVVHLPNTERVLLELKAVTSLNGEHLKQLEYYLAHFGIANGYLVNFPHDPGFPRLDKEQIDVEFKVEILSGQDCGLDRDLRPRQSNRAQEPPQIYKVSAQPRLKGPIAAEAFPVPPNVQPSFSEPSTKAWPALTKKGTKCKLCLELGVNLFCHHHL